MHNSSLCPFFFFAPLFLINASLFPNNIAWAHFFSSFFTKICAHSPSLSGSLLDRTTASLSSHASEAACLRRIAGRLSLNHAPRRQLVQPSRPYFKRSIQLLLMATSEVFRIYYLSLYYFNGVSFFFFHCAAFSLKTLYRFLSPANGDGVSTPLPPPFFFLIFSSERFWR